MSNILIIGVFEGLFLAMLLITKKKRTISDRILALFFIVFALSTGLSYLETYNRNNGFPYPVFILTAAPFLLLHGPVLWLYIKSHTDQFFKFKAVYLLNLIPFAAMLIHHAVAFYTLSDVEKIHLVQTESFKQNISYLIFVMAIAISPVIYFYLGIKQIDRYKLKIEGYFSQEKGKDLKWLKVIIGSWLILYCIINSFFIADLFIPVASFGTMQFFSFVAGAIYVVFIGFFGLKQENVFLTQPIQIDLEKVVRNQLRDNYEKIVSVSEDKFVQELIGYMNDQKPYLEPELTIKMLSDRLNVSSEYFSEVINNNLNKNFFDFINYYRIEEFKTRCREERYRNLTILGIAFDCGFNSKAAFYRAFNKNVGMSPSAYILVVSQKSETLFPGK